MNAHTMMLALVVGIFMSIWSNDTPEARARVAQRRGSVSLATHHAQPAPAIAAVSSSEAKTSVPVWPAEITPGMYRAVSHAGDVCLVDVPGDSAPGPVVARDFYVSDDEAGERWYFIRIGTNH